MTKLSLPTKNMKEKLREAAWPCSTWFGDVHIQLAAGGRLIPQELGRMGLGDGGDAAYADEKNAPPCWNLHTRSVYLCATESSRTLRWRRRACMSVCASACDGEAAKAAAASSEFSHSARLGAQGKTSRHRRSPAIFRPPLPPAGTRGRGAPWSMIQNEMILMNAEEVPHFTSAPLWERRCCWRRRVRYVYLGRLIYSLVATFDLWSREEFCTFGNKSKG